MGLKKHIAVVFLATHLSISSMYGTLQMINPVTAIDLNGISTAVWVNNLNNVISLQSATKLWIGPWGTPTVLYNSANPIYELKIDINDSGSILIAWKVLDTLSEKYILYTAHKSSGGAWSSSTIVSDPALSVDKDFNIHINTLSEMIVVWNVYTPSGDLVAYSTNSTFLGSWTTPVLINP